MTVVAFPDEPDLTPHEVAELSGVSYWTVLAEIRRGHLRAYERPGGRKAIRRDDFCAWAYGTPVVPDQPADTGAPVGRRSSRRRPAGSVDGLDELERARGAA